jgi:hypothetical protein
VNRQLFPYKPFPPLNSQSKPKEIPQGDKDVEMASVTVTSVKIEVPAEGNREIPIGAWTDEERRQHDEHLRAISRRQVDYVTGSVQSTRCTGTTMNKKGNSGRYGSVESSDNISHLAWLSLRVYLPLEMSAVSLFIIILFAIT